MDTTTASITIGWNAPFDDGGCPVTGYAIFRDEADQTTPATEVNVATDPAVRGIPTLRSLIVTNLPTNSEGQYVRFAVRAYNREGWVDSTTTVAILFAAVPSPPPTPPQLVDSESNSTVLSVTLPELAAALTGNSDIQAYSLEIDEGHQELF